MLGFAGSSYALFAVVWGLMCLVSAALVTDTMLRGSVSASRHDAGQHGDTPAPPDAQQLNG